MPTQLLNTDCMEYMENCGDKFFDLAIVDPPYRDENQPTKEMRSNGSMESLNGRPTLEYFDELQRISKNQIVWGANNFQLPQFKGFIVWDKNIPFDFTMSMAEIASISEGLGTISKIYNLRAAGADYTRIHPTQKPVALYKWLLKNYAEKGQKIIDTHLGSGSSAIAAHYFGCDFVGLEIDKDYFEAAQARFKKETAQVSMW